MPRPARLPDQTIGPAATEEQLGQVGSGAGPEDGERDAEGFINCEVIGFVLSGANLPTVYLSGDNASIRTSAEIAQRIPDVDVAVLHVGAARVPGRFRDRPVSMDSIRTAAAAVLGASA